MGGSQPYFEHNHPMDLWDRYYTSIGRAVVAGGELEGVLGFLLAGLAKIEDERVLRILGPDSFAGMITGCRQLIKLGDSEIHAELLTGWERRRYPSGAETKLFTGGGT